MIQFIIGLIVGLIAGYFITLQLIMRKAKQMTDEMFAEETK